MPKRKAIAYPRPERRGPRSPGVKEDGGTLFLLMPQSLWPLGLFLFVGTGARVTAGTPKIRQALLALSCNSPLAWDCNQTLVRATGGASPKRRDGARQGAIAHRQTEMILLFRREIQRARGLSPLSFAFEQGAIGDALHRQHLDFGFLVIRDASGRFRYHDERLRTVACIEGTLELQRLNAALLARVFLQRGLKHFRFGMQLVGDFRRQYGHHHGNRRFDFDAHLLPVMVRRKPSINLQERRELILLFDLSNPLILRLDAVFHAVPAEVLNVHVVR